MKIIHEIIDSIRGSAQARVKDPVVGSFIVVWCICNWDKLALLFFGNETVEARIENLVVSMSIIENIGLIFEDFDLLVLPFFITCFYLFVIPNLSLWVQEKQQKVVLSQDTHAIEQAKSRVKKRIELNKLSLRASPKESFLAKEVEMDLERQARRDERRHSIKEYIDNKVRASREDAKKKSNENEREQLELESKKRKDELEKQRFESQLALHKATISSSRFPIIYKLMSDLSSSLLDDNVTLSHNGLAQSLATLFGYHDDKEMIDDPEFNNENLSKVRYLYNKDGFLAEGLSQVVLNEKSENEDLSDESLYDHLQGITESLSIHLFSHDDLATEIVERVSEDSYNMVLNDEAFSSALSTSDTIYDDVYIDFDYAQFSNDDFVVYMSGSASGEHRNDQEIPGRELSFSLKASCKPLIGRFGLSDYRIEVSGVVLN